MPGLGPDELRAGIDVYLNLRWLFLGLLALLVVGVVTVYPFILGFYPALLLSLLVAAGLLLNAVYLIWRRRGGRLRELAALQSLNDAVILTGLVYLTGGMESPLLFGYGMIILSAGILLGRRMSYLSGIFCLALFLIPQLLEAAGLIPSFHVSDILRHFGRDRTSTGQVLAGIAIAATVTGSFALLSAYLFGRAEERQRRLVEAERRRDELHRLLLHQAVSMQEEERERIARELHDDTGQLLSALLMRLDLLKGRLEPATRSAQETGTADKPPDETGLAGLVTDLKRLAEQALRGVHRLSFELRPALLDDLGLVAATRAFARSLGHDAGVEAYVTEDGTWPRLPRDTETELFRVLQEALRNVVKHARATRVWVRFLREGELWRVEVIDNGRGFDPASVWEQRRQGTKALGLLGMEERVALIGGTLAIDSRPGSGCRVTVTIPVRAAPAAGEESANMTATAPPAGGKNSGSKSGGKEASEERGAK